eukprot:9609096-Alexandrium_andersonii.AAC.1
MHVKAHARAHAHAYAHARAQARAQAHAHAQAYTEAHNPDLFQLVGAQRSAPELSGPLRILPGSADIYHRIHGTPELS